MPACARVLLPVGIAIGTALGCASFGSLPTPLSGEGSPLAANSDENGPKRQPKPSTLVAYGELHEKAAAEPGRSPTDQEELRSKARLAYQQALQVSPTDLPAMLALGRLYASEGDYERAVASYDRAIQSHPKDASPRYELGMCYARRRSWDLAIQNLQKAVDMDPENRSYRHVYGLCLARAQRLDEGYAVLAKLEGSANAHYDLARMLHHLEQDDACREHLRLALTQNPEHLEAQQLLESLEGGYREPVYPVVPASAEIPSANPSQAALGRPVRVVQP